MCKLPLPDRRINYRISLSQNSSQSRGRDQDYTTCPKMSELYSLLIRRKRTEKIHSWSSQARDILVHDTQHRAHHQEQNTSGCAMLLSLKALHHSFTVLCFAFNTCCQNLKISSFLLNFHPAVSCECLCTVTQILLCHMSVRLVLLSEKVNIGGISFLTQLK